MERDSGSSLHIILRLFLLVLIPSLLLLMFEAVDETIMLYAAARLATADDEANEFDCEIEDNSDETAALGAPDDGEEFFEQGEDDDDKQGEQEVVVMCCWSSIEGECVAAAPAMCMVLATKSELELKGP